MLPKRVSPMSRPACRRTLTAAALARRAASLTASGASLESDDRLAQWRRPMPITEVPL